jgi:orotate phosphoribosyltransferase-like protein
MTRDIINQVRELLERHLNVVEIASKLNLDLDTVKIAIDIIKEIIT